ncbi:dipeptidase PepE [Bacteroidia bacterium]|nr:dipeptidase PepE [Bacteroidia bacterium]MDC1395062.1 dipeptidase PepE [Bacteroidia bacterium]
MAKLLLLSNSTNYGEKYMQWCESIIASFVLEHRENIVFIPYAGVTISYKDYTKKVNGALARQGIVVQNIEDFDSQILAIEKATAIFVGGGNTFHLLKILQDKGLSDAIRKKVQSGTPYVGWSAGSNIASPTICTTNDMPIVEPTDFNSLGLVDFQINSHYTEKTIDGHGGESRKQRLEEYLAANQDNEIICLPEESYLVSDNESVQYKGTNGGKILYYQSEKNIPNKYSFN